MDRHGNDPTHQLTVNIALRPSRWKNFRQAGQNSFFFITTPHRPRRFCSKRESAWLDLLSGIAFIGVSESFGIGIPLPSYSELKFLSIRQSL